MSDARNPIKNIHH